VAESVLSVATQRGIGGFGIRDGARRGIVKGREGGTWTCNGVGIFRKESAVCNKTFALGVGGC
jgi:hypothetical protein